MDIHSVSVPFVHLIRYFGELFDGNYGLSVVLLTVLIRLVLLPLMWRQQKASRAVQSKMAVMQPEIKALKDKYKDRQDRDSQAAMQQEMMKLYQQHQFNPLNMGCLPMLLQLPVVMGFYYAIGRTPEIAAHEFVWFNLGHPDLVMAMIAAAIYWVQVRFAPISQPSPSQPNNLKFLMYLSPVMIGLFSLNAPAVMPLYWAVGGFFLIGQSFLFTRLMK